MSSFIIFYHHLTHNYIILTLWIYWNWSFFGWRWWRRARWIWRWYCWNSVKKRWRIDHRCHLNFFFIQWITCDFYTSFWLLNITLNFSFSPHLTLHLSLSFKLLIWWIFCYHRLTITNNDLWIKIYDETVHKHDKQAMRMQKFQYFISIDK